MGNSQRIEFSGHNGDALAARLDMPEGVPRAFALFVHCFTCSKDIFAVSRISKELSSQGIAVLRFDFTGLGSSEGEFANTNFSSNIQDILKAVDYIRENFDQPQLVIGHSLGGAAVLAAAPHIPGVKAVVTIGAPADAGHVTENFRAHLDDIEAKGEAEVTLAGRQFTIQKQFLDDLEGQNVLDAAKSMKKALLVCHAPLDNVVGIDNASSIFMAAKHPKSFLSLDTADHLLTEKADAIYAANCIAAWAKRYIDGAEEKEAEPLEHGQVEVAEMGTGPYTQTVRAGRHALLADEPVDMGGQDRGPGPYEYLLGALGACTSITLRMYADRKELPLDKVSVRLSHRKVHAEDCADCEAKESMIEEITREITLVGNLDSDQRQKLKEIANKCPVHKTLEGEIKVRTELAG